MNKLGWILAQQQMDAEDDDKCPCCSNNLVENCCIECGEVYG